MLHLYIHCVSLHTITTTNCWTHSNYLLYSFCLWHCRTPSEELQQHTAILVWTTLYQKSFSFCNFMWYFFSDVQQTLLVAYVLHVPVFAHCTLAVCQIDIQYNKFWVPMGKSKRHNQKNERSLYLRQSLSLCSTSGRRVQSLWYSFIADTLHTPKCAIYSGRIPAAWSEKGIISHRYSGWWICRCHLYIPMATSPLCKELWGIKAEKKKHCKPVNDMSKC